MICEVCAKGPAQEHGGVTVYRANDPGQVPAIWRCREHQTRPLECDVQRLIDALAGVPKEGHNG